MSTNIDLGTKLNIVMDYYQGHDTVWDKMDITGLSADQINAMYNSLPASSFNVDLSPSGAVLGRSYTNPFELPVTQGANFDSNIPGGSYGGGNTFTGNVPANLETDSQSGLPVRQTAGSTTSSGNFLPTVVDRVSLAVAGVNIGAKLGMKIDEALYSLNPKWWDTHLPSINPQTWNDLVGQSALGDFFLRTLFGLTGNNMTGYISEEMLAYYYQMMRDLGFFPDTTAHSEAYVREGEISPYSNSPILLTTGDVLCIMTVGNYDFIASKGNAEYLVLVEKPGYPNALTVIAISKNPFTATYTYINKSTQQPGSTYSYNGEPTISSVTGNTYYQTEVASFNSMGNVSTYSSLLNTPSNASGAVDTAIAVYDGTIHQAGERQDGVSDLTGATQYPPTNITGSTTQDVLNELKQQYPDLFTDSIKEKTMQPDGTIKETTYVPIPWATTGTTGDEATTGEGKTQTSTDVDPETGDQVMPTSTPEEPSQPPDTGTGDTPVPALPTGSASSLWAIYNPSQSELNSFGAWLWSSNFVEQLKKLFNDPMQAIIGVHKVFATPSTGGSQSIKCGYLDSGVSASVVTNQYTTVDCGSASLREYFGNVFDYDPFTKVSLFLPFIGIVPLNTADVMRGTISVKYKVDVITGACLAEVSVSRDLSGGIIYTYSGSCIVSYPLSSGSYVGVVQAALTTAIGVGMSIASGGASAGMMAGAAISGLSHAKTQVQHSGQFSGSSGAMGGKKPYLIVSRPQTRTPTNVNEYLGLPSYTTGKVSQFSGFTKFKEIHFESDKAFSIEIDEINDLLKSGIII